MTAQSGVVDTVEDIYIIGRPGGWVRSAVLNRRVRVTSEFLIPNQLRLCLP
jgi:hypothetical protein